MSDYVKMWEDLDMDIETHDSLCEVLPISFTDIYLSQENRPEGMAFYDMVVSEIHGIRPSELIELQKQGKKVVGTFCVYVPDEVIHATGAAFTGLCGGSQFWVPGGEKVLPRDMCPLIKASVGAHLDRTCPFFRIADIFIGETTCDGKKKAYEILAEDAEVYVMDLPQMKRDKDILKWKEEVSDFSHMLGKFTGNELTHESLKEGIRVINEKRKALARVNNARKATNIPISGKDTLLMMQIAFFDDPQRCADMANVLADELEERIKEGVSVFPEGTKRIMITGTPMSIPNWKLHHLLETSGAAVVCEEACTGSRYFTNLVDESGSTLDEQYQAIAERYMNINCACFTPNTGRIDDIIKMAEEYKVDGVIDLNLKFCTLYATEGKSVEEALREKDIPVLRLETDYADSDSGQLRTRIEAFLEMLG